MNNRILIIGSTSDLIQPLIRNSRAYQLEILGINRIDWDLSVSSPSPRVLETVYRFSPNHLIFAAGHNEITNINSDPQEVIESIERHLAINCLSFVSIVLTLMKKLSSSLVSIHALSSLYGIYGRRSRIPYCLSKHALEGAVKCLAIEFPQTQILGYRPGFFETKLTQQNISSPAQEKLKVRIPSHRFGEPEEISSLILAHILSPVPYFTGHCLTVDGGMSAGGLFDQ